MVEVNPLWQHAAQLFESASAVRGDEQTDLAILIDERMGLRMVDASGWQLHALRHEYQATTAYTIKRNASGVVVEAANDSDHCTLAKKVSAQSLLQTMASIPAHHLIYPAAATAA
jgi:hypothetical protein